MKLRMTTVGDLTTEVQTYEYELKLIDNSDTPVVIKAIDIDKISSPVGKVDRGKICKILGVPQTELNRPSEGEIDLLVGLQYAAYHPDRRRAVGHLLLYENRFGKTVGGSHADIQERTMLNDSCFKVRSAAVMHIQSSMEPFFEIESLGVSCIPKCGACSCGTCHPGGKAMTLKDERELEMIERGLEFDPDKGRWQAEYPWIKDPSMLKNNRRVVLAKLQSTERRLAKNPEYQVEYSKQIQELLDRKAARMVTNEELRNYKGPTFYLSHHAVSNPLSKSTRLRIVFDSKASYLGSSLNDCLAKGPSLLNQLVGVLLRFRQERVAFIGDVRKMYYSIDIPHKDQMMHLFLWRNCDPNEPVSTYAVTTVNMGDKPSATIAQVALRRTAEMAKAQFPEASKIIVENSYMDDISASVPDSLQARARMREIDDMLNTKGFFIKEWFSNTLCPEENPDPQLQNTLQTVDSKQMGDMTPISQVLSGDTDDRETEGILGLRWDLERDELRFKFKAELTIPDQYTKRSILSVANSIFDPLGLLTPFSTKIKIALRSAWAFEPKLGWDTPLPEPISDVWEEILKQIPLLPSLSFPRALTLQAVAENPMLVILCDGSEHAYGATAYIRWKMTDGSWRARLVMAKSKVAPLKTVDIVRIELCGAVLGARLRKTVQDQMSVQFQRVIHLTDSEIVHAMIHRQSYGFNTFVANRVGEIHRNTQAHEWAWIPGSSNIADLTTRGCSPRDLEKDTEWQNGPKFLQKCEKEWPARFEVNKDTQLIEAKHQKKAKDDQIRESPFVGVVQATETETLASRIDATRFSKWPHLRAVTARILYLYRKYRSNSEVGEISSVDSHAAEILWIKEAQSSIESKKCINLKPTKDENGVWRVGGRTERWMESTWNRQKFILLPKDAHVSVLIARYLHESGGHLGVAASISKVRSRFWIIGLRKLMKAIVQRCVHCREKGKVLQSQTMSTLPVERLKPSPSFLTVGIDYFGPYATKGEVQKRVRGKSFGVIITCFGCRAVYVDVAHDASTDGFLQVLRRFVCVRGWPAVIYSDQGTQFVGASNELKEILRGMSWEQIKDLGWPEQKIEWRFSPPDAKWYNGATESLVKSVKRALNAAVGENVMQFSELQTCMFEAAEMVNARPIGLHPNSPDEEVYLCPNDLLLGRATNHVPQGPFKERCSDRHRFDFVQSIAAAFWKRWTSEVFPNMVVQKKWHTESRNIAVGDVVLVQDLNPVRGKWKMAIVEQPITSADGKVRRAMISYKTDEGTRSLVERAVQKLIVIVTKEE